MSRNWRIALAVVAFLVATVVVVQAVVGPEGMQRLLGLGDRPAAGREGVGRDPEAKDLDGDGIPDTATAKSKPGEPARYGEGLRSLDQPPAKTVATVKKGARPTDVEYAIVFTPYGYGPQLGTRTVVVGVTRLQDATGKQDAGGAGGLVGQRLLLRTTARSEGAVTSGGTYSGSIVFQPEGDALAPVLVSAKRLPKGED